MLVISRKVSESFMIGESVITIQKIAGNRVSVAINAPKEVKVWRGEKQGKEPKEGSPPHAG